MVLFLFRGVSNPDSFAYFRVRLPAGTAASEHIYDNLYCYGFFAFVTGNSLIFRRQKSP